MGDSLIVLEWLNKANTDLKCAKILFEHDGGNEVVAFHSQQAIEKALKGIILYFFGILESGHSLLYLCKKVIEKDSEFSNYIESCAFVNQYYIETRYPNENPIVVKNEEAQKCIDIAEDILNKVSSIVNG